MNTRPRSVLLVFVASVCFGTLGIFGEFAPSIGISISTLLLFRFGLATVVIWVGLFTVGKFPVLAPRRAAIAIGLGFLYGLMTVFYFLSLHWLTAGIAALVYYTYPVLVFVLSMLVLDEPLTGRKLLALSTVLAGVSLTIGVDTPGVNPTGIGIVSLAALAYALYMIGSRLFVTDVSSTAQTAYNFFGAALCMCLYGVFVSSPSMPAGHSQWLVIFGISTLGTIIPIGLLLIGLRRLEASRASIIGTAEPMTAVLLGALVLGESVTASLAGGGLLILSGIVLGQQ